EGLDTEDTRRLAEVGRTIRAAIVEQPFPEDLESDIRVAYAELVLGAHGLPVIDSATKSVEDISTQILQCLMAAARAAGRRDGRTRP
ncbi:MAG: hypothetical protein ACTHJH_14865, partial [Marmoricola sp.]